MGAASAGPSSGPPTGDASAAGWSTSMASSCSTGVATRTSLAGGWGVGLGKVEAIL